MVRTDSFVLTDQSAPLHSNSVLSKKANMFFKDIFEVERFWVLKFYKRIFIHNTNIYTHFLYLVNYILRIMQYVVYAMQLCLSHFLQKALMCIYIAPIIIDVFIYL